MLLNDTDDYNHESKINNNLCGYIGHENNLENDKTESKTLDNQKNPTKNESEFNTDEATTTFKTNIQLSENNRHNETIFNNCIDFGIHKENIEDKTLKTIENAEETKE